MNDKRVHQNICLWVQHNLQARKELTKRGFVEPIAITRAHQRTMAPRWRNIVGSVVKPNVCSYRDNRSGTARPHSTKAVLSSKKWSNTFTGNLFGNEFTPNQQERRQRHFIAIASRFDLGWLYQVQQCFTFSNYTSWSLAQSTHV